MKVEQEIKILEEKVSQAKERVAQVEKQYAFSLAKLERQKKAVEIAKNDIDRVKINIAQQLCMLQKLRECIKKMEVAENEAE